MIYNLSRQGAADWATGEVTLEVLRVAEGERETSSRHALPSRSSRGKHLRQWAPLVGVECTPCPTVVTACTLTPARQRVHTVIALDDVPAPIPKVPNAGEKGAER